MLFDFAPGSRPQSWTGGHIYNPEDGRTYSATLTQRSTDLLEVEGCVLFVCSRQVWRKLPATCNPGTYRSPNAQALTMDSSRLELKLPPPVVALGVALLMWIASRFAGPATLTAGTRLVIALAIGGMGLVVGLTAIFTFSRAGTTVNPTKPQATAALITHGVYRFSRNPMYVSLLLYLVGFAAYLESWPSAVLLPVFVLYMDRFQIAPEERALAEKFPEEFAAYRRTVRRWI